MRKRGADIELNLGELPAIPSDWKWGRVEDSASDERNAIVDGPFGSNLKLSDYIDPPGVPVLTTGNLRGDYSPDSVRYISQSKFEELRRSEVRGGDILVAKIGSCGLTGVYPQEMPSAIIPANLLKMTVHPDASRKFVLYYLNSPTFSRFLKTIITATAQPAFNVSKFRQLPLPIVPRPAQDTIVAEIEKQFTRLEAGVAALRRVQANLKRYRAAVLKAACEGQLVPTEAELVGRVPPRGGRAKAKGNAAWGHAAYNDAPFESGEALLARILIERRQNWQGRGQYREPAAPDIKKLGPLPEGWMWATADQVSSQITDGEHIQPKYAPEGYPMLSAKHVRNGFVIYTDVPLISEADFKACLKRCAPTRDDILVVCVGATTGRAAIVGNAKPFAVVRSVLLIRTLIHPRFMLAWVRSPWCQTWIQSASGSSAQAHFYINNAKQMCVPLPPLAEQTRIVAEVERRLSVVEELEAVVSANLQRAARLRQSILQKAFTGQLSANGG